MDGLIVNQPYANMIIEKQKTWEIRTRDPPQDKIDQEIFLLSKGNILGTIKIQKSNGPLTLDELQKHQHLHKSDMSFADDDLIAYAWEMNVCQAFEKPKKYHHPNGARVWVKNVMPFETYAKGKITNYF